jgi:uncharacterized protein
MTELPMFPLGTVLLPGAALPLQVFEPRYRALVHDCLAGDREFGVVLIERGSEVGGGDTRFDVGCVARIAEALEVADGRWALMTVGIRRIRVTRWLDDAPYPRAEVEEWPDPAPGEEVEPTRAVVEALLRRVLALAAELGDAVAPAVAGVADDVVLASYQLAARAPIGPLDRLAMLGAPSVADRYTLLRDALVDVEAVLASRLAGG